MARLVQGDVGEGVGLICGHDRLWHVVRRSFRVHVRHCSILVTRTLKIDADR